MAKLKLSIVTAERTLLAEEEVDMVSAPGSLGRLGILPNHTPLLTTLAPGDLYYQCAQDLPCHFACSGGFLQVADNHVIVLADTAERAEEIDEARALETRRRAEALLRDRKRLSQDELVRAEISLRKAITRLQVVRYRRQRPQVPLRRGRGAENVDE
ncbi:MAG: F0F1 ATP synthase subunit epsilon [Chloroflexia bacterium]|nr:F0F1 ATP synthase subunit epsilon [Chloroflexia bacterium]